jgi:hypothetical protein
MLLRKNERDKIPFRRRKNETTPMVRTVQRMEEGRLPKRGTGMATIREKENRQTQIYLGGGD